ncbi:hypothetical protein VTG60DRAFT_7316 [Thermothelomyces hinnuleus]
MAFHTNLPLPPSTTFTRSVSDTLNRNLNFLENDSDADLFSGGPGQSLGRAVLARISSDPSSSTRKVLTRPIEYPSNSPSLADDTKPTGGGLRQSFPYYSRNTNNRRRDQQSLSESASGIRGAYSRSLTTDTATAQAVKTARYPVLYEKLKAPAAAKKALKIWKERKQGAVGEIPAGALALETHDRRLLQDGRTASDNNGSDRTAQVQDPGEANRRDRGKAPRDSSRSTTRSGNRSLAPLPSAASPVTAPSTSGALVASRKARAANDLPPQHMTFSEPLLEQTKRGRRLRITCTLEKSYPNFHIECDYTYVDRSERVNSSQTDTRISSAVITTRENVWIVVFEQMGYNEEFIKGLVGETEYARLDGDVSEPIKGHGKPSDLATVKVHKKIKIPEGFDLGGIWCKAADFYEMRIYVPAKEYKHKE